MIRFLEEKDKNAVIGLWQEAFGEAEKEIQPFLDFIGKDMLVMEENGQIFSMLSLIRVKIGAETGRYVYAVATDKRFRGKGFASRLLSYAKKYASENGESFLVLLPRNASLFAFYEKNGFTPLCCAKRISRKIEKSALNAEKITAKEYFELKKTYFSGEKYVEWDIKTLEFMKKAYRGEFLKAGDVGIAFCHKQSDLVIIHELLTDAAEAEIIDAFGNFLGASMAEGIKAEKNGEKFAVIYPPEYRDAYFGLGMQ